MKKVISNFDREREADTLTLGRSVSQKMSGNAFFPTPSPTMSTFTDNLDEYATALTAAKTGDRTAIVRKNLANQLVKSNLTDLALYVNSTSKGNLEMLSSSGLPLTKDRSRITITAPEIKSLLQGLNAGSMLLKASRIYGAKSYQFQCAMETATGRTAWVTVTDSRCKYEFTELEQGKKYWFRVAAIGGNGQVAYSSEVAAYVMQRDMIAAA